MDLIVLCLLLALVLFCFEVFVPGGVFFTLGAISLMAASFFAYEEFGFLAGVIAFCGGLALAVAFLIIELRWISRSQIGRRFLLHEKTLEDRALYEQSKDQMVGKSGVTVTRLNPIGTVRIDGKTYEASSRSGMLPQGTDVTVTAQDNFRILVERL